MEQLKCSIGGLKNAVQNVIGFMVGNNDESGYSFNSVEVIDCESDCSNCNSDNRSISLASCNSSQQSNHPHNRILQELDAHAIP